MQNLLSQSALRDAIGPAIHTAVQSLLTNHDLLPVLGSFVSNLVSGVAGNQAVQEFLSEQVTSFVTATLGGNLTATQIAGAVSGAVQGLLANSAVGTGLGNVVGSALTGFLGQTGVGAALLATVGQVVDAVLAGTDPATALQAAWLRCKPIRRSGGVGATVAGVVTSLVGDSGLISALTVGRHVLLTEVAGDATVRTYVGQLLGPTFGPAVVAVLADPAAVADLADTVSSVVSRFLGQAGVAGALSGAGRSVRRRGARRNAAWPRRCRAPGSRCRRTRRSRPRWTPRSRRRCGGVWATPPCSRRPGRRPRTSSSTSSRVRRSTSVVAPVAGQVAKGTVEAFLGKPAAQRFISGLLVDIANGLPTSEVAGVVIQAVIKSPALQIAVGMSIGQGIGSLLGDNIFGAVVGGVVGVAASALVLSASGIASLVEGVRSLFGGAAAVAGPAGSRYSVVEVSPPACCRR